MEPQPARNELFPDGVLGIKGLRRNRAWIEQQADVLLNDAEALATLEDIGKLGSIEYLVDQGLRASTRAQQRPFMSSLSQIIDAVGLHERAQVEASQLDEGVNTALSSALQFLGPEQQEAALQLAERQATAFGRSDFAPSAAMDEMREIQKDALSLVNEASARVNSQFISPLNDLRLNVATARQRLLDTSQGSLTSRATPSEVKQILDLVSADPGSDLGSGIGFSLLGVGFSSDDIPDMTYGELLNVLHSTEKGAIDFVNGELERRGVSNLEAAKTTLAPTQRVVRNEAQAQITEAITAERGEAPEPAESDAVASWMGALPEGAQLDFENMVATDPATGEVFRPTPTARTELEALRRRRANRVRPTND